MVPDIDINDEAINMLPSEQRRQPWWVAFILALVSPVARLYGIFKAYMTGEALPYYDVAVTYGAGDKAQYNYATWESLQAGNTGNAPDSSPLWWLKRNDSFIGATEQAKYNGRYLNLTYQLNRQFQQQITAAGLTGFRQPPYPPPYDFGTGSGTFSDIYITNTVDAYPSFLVGADETGSDSVGTTASSGFVTLTEDFAAASQYLFDVNVPSAVHALINATPDTANAIIRNFVDRYCPAGIQYNIVTY